MSYIKHYGFDDEGNMQPLPSAAVFDPYADENQAVTSGSMWGPDMDGKKRPQGKPEDIPVERIITKRTR